MPPWSDFEPFIVSGLALGGVYALSGVGLVVLYRATGVLYLAFGAVGAMGALTAWSLGQAGAPGWVTWLTCIAVAALITLVYGLIFGPALSRREPLVKAVATIGLTLILYGLMDLLWTTSGGEARSLTLPSDNGGFSVGQVQVNWTQVIALAAAVVITVGTGMFLRYTKLGTAMRAMANDREITATLGRPGPQGRGGGLARLRGARGHRRPAARRPGRARRHHAHLPGHLVAGRGADRPAALDHGHLRGRDRGRPAA